MPPDIDAIAREMQDLLPTDGTPVSNRIIRLMLSRQLGTIVGQQAYFEARDRLFNQGVICTSAMGARRG